MDQVDIRSIDSLYLIPAQHLFRQLCKPFRILSAAAALPRGIASFLVGRTPFAARGWEGGEVRVRVRVRVRV
jgi:hypothetical protein